MKLDSEEQRTMLLEIFSKTAFVGSSIETVYQLKKSLENAPIEVGGVKIEKSAS